MARDLVNFCLYGVLPTEAIRVLAPAELDWPPVSIQSVSVDACSIGLKAPGSSLEYLKGKLLIEHFIGVVIVGCSHDFEVGYMEIKG